MCIGKTPKPPPVPPVTPAPTRESTTRKVAKGTAKSDPELVIKSVREQAKKDQTRQGIYANIRTSRSGDFFYGKSTSKTEKYAAGDAGIASFGSN